MKAVFEDNACRRDGGRWTRLASTHVLVHLQQPLSWRTLSSRLSCVTLVHSLKRRKGPNRTGFPSDRLLPPSWDHSCLAGSPSPMSCSQPVALAHPPPDPTAHSRGDQWVRTLQAPQSCPDKGTVQAIGGQRLCVQRCMWRSEFPVPGGMQAEAGIEALRSD